MERKVANTRLTKEQKEFVKLLSILKTSLTYNQIQALFEDKFQKPISHKQIKTLRRKFRDEIDLTRESEELTYELAKKSGLISLTKKVNRLMILEDLVHQSVEGSPFEVHTARGDILTVNKRDFNVAITALKEIRNESVKDDIQQPNYVINIGDSTPPEQEDYEELPGDEEL